jgi:hypothetical protein
VLFAETVQLSVVDLPLRRISLHNVQLVPDNHYAYIFICLLTQIIQPLLHAEPRRPLRNIVNHECTESLAVVSSRDGNVLFLA